MTKPDNRNGLSLSDDPTAYSVGVLFSQSGPMAVTEEAHLKGTLIAIDEINDGGGVGGVPLAPIVYDPRSDPSLYRELANKLLLEHRVSVIFGCCSSASRKAVLPLVERHGALLFYPSFYEGFEYSPNVIYTGATPNQTVIPLVQHLFKHFGKRLALVGSDYIYAREINRIVKEFMVESGGDVAEEIYIPLGADEGDFSLAVERLKASHPNTILSTVVGGDTAKLYRVCHDMQIEPKHCPIASLTTSESELAALDPDVRAGHLTALSYFESVPSPANRNFIERYSKRYSGEDLPCVYSETAYFQVHLLAGALGRDLDQSNTSLLDAILGAQFKAPQGNVMIDPDNNHIYVTPRIGRSTERGTFDIIWEAPDCIKPDPYLVAYDRTIAAIAPQ